MYDGNFFDIFFFGLNSNKSVSDRYKINKKWAGLNNFYDLVATVMGRFEYEGMDELPKMDPRFFELTLIADGCNVTAPDMGEAHNYKVGYGNKFQEFGYYNNVTAMDFMGMSHGSFIPDLKGNVMPDCVITFDNMYNIPPLFRIKWYADMLTEIQGSINTCIANMKGTVIFKCSKEQEPAIKRAWKNANDGTPVIISFAPNEGGMDMDPEVITNPQTGDILKQLQETYDKYLAMFLTEFGINANGVINKMAGVSGMELMQNDQKRAINLNNALVMRQKGIEKINKMFGTNITVKLAEPLDVSNELENLTNYSESNTIINSNDDSRSYK